MENDLPVGLANPARRALAAAGCLRLEQLAKHSKAEVKQMHGIGPKPLNLLRDTLQANGLGFAGNTQN